MSFPDSLQFLAEADTRGFPVMIGESTPRGIGARGGEKSWIAWFAPYFEFLDVHPNIKAISYIAGDWSKYPPWNTWGDARLTADPELLRNVQCELSNPKFINGGSEAEVRRALGLTEQRAAINPKNGGSRADVRRAFGLSEPESASKPKEAIPGKRNTAKLPKNTDILAR